MKKNILFIAVIIYFSVNIYSQNFTFTRTSAPIVYGTVDSLEIKSYGYITNLTSDTIDLQITISNVVTPAGWEIGMCTWVLCYGPGFYNVTEPCPPGQQLFYVYFFPNNTIPGMSCCRVTVTYQGQSVFQDFCASTNPIGIKQLSSEVKTFTLEQNYPNPFNPKTNISFSIPEKSFVSLKVFDILGRLVADLVNQDMNAGEYEYDFDAKALSSGMYYYSLSAGENVTVKKMVLVK